MHLARCVGFGQLKRQFVSVLALKKFCDLLRSGTRLISRSFSSYRPTTKLGIDSDKCTKSQFCNHFLY